MKRIIIFILLFFFIIGMIGCNRDSKDYEYFEEDTQVTTGIYSMDAKLTFPKSKESVPAVVMVHGSGPSNMDEEIGQLKPFKDLAEGLAKKGVASIRYDKITYAYLNEIANNYNFTIYDEVVNVALSAVSILKNDSRIDANNIFILGHSLGGQLAPIILNEDDSINGAIMMAGTPRHILDILMDQVMTFQGESQYNQIYPIYNYIRYLEEVVEGEHKTLYFGCYQKYWVNYNAINFEEETKTASLKHPLLIMHGELDIQVPSSTLELYQDILQDSNNVVYKKYDKLNHCFVDGTGETYQNAYQIKKKIPEEVFSDIVDFINSVKK